MSGRIGSGKPKGDSGLRQGLRDRMGLACCGVVAIAAAISLPEKLEKMEEHF